ncbi:MAG: stalk domain-containing protein [Oscillospiraceae bacterium]|nr:stalk domain-containing protein [Oscillospiraceae bacterium]
MIKFIKKAVWVAVAAPKTVLKTAPKTVLKTAPKVVLKTAPKVVLKTAATAAATAVANAVSTAVANAVATAAIAIAGVTNAVATAAEAIADVANAVATAAVETAAVASVAVALTLIVLLHTFAPAVTAQAAVSAISPVLTAQAAVSAISPVLSVQATLQTLVITGDGVERETRFTIDEIKAMNGYISQNAYSAWNTWPSKRTYYARGVALAELLRLAGLKSNATTVNVATAPEMDGSAGYNMTFLLSDLLRERYTFEGVKSAVPAILAFKLGERSFSDMDDTDIRLIFGQLAEQEQTTAGFVQSVRTITVTRDPAPRLPPPEASVKKLSDGRYEVTLKSGQASAKVYYTTDGATPTVNSKMYNISAPQWQPELNAPFTAAGDVRVKAIAVASGFINSEVLSFTPATLNSANGTVPGSSSAAPAQTSTRPLSPTPARASRPSPTPAPMPAQTPTLDSTGAEDTPRVILDGKTLSFDVPPTIINNRTLVPLRAIFEEMGAKVEWNNTTQTVTATKGGIVVVLTIGSLSPTVNGNVIPIDQPGMIVDGRTLAPLRFVAEAFGGVVEWDGATNTAIITTK